MSLYLRDQLILQCWVASHLHQPQADPRGNHFPVQVWGVIDDPRYKPVRSKPFADIVSFWPSLGYFTVTHQCQADEEVIELRVRVTHWQPLPPTPDSWS